jgi:arylsulfatase
MMFSALPGLAAEGVPIKYPNLIVILTDDQGYNDVACYGSTRIETPHLDRMAAEGTRFTDFYVQPVCGVSRAALLTGCYPIRVAEVNNTKSGHPVLHPGEITLAEVLKARGYSTALVGKWHLAGGGKNTRGPGTGPFRRELMPGAQGFEYFFGTPAHNGFTREPDPKRYITELMRNDELLESPANLDLLTQKYTQEAIRFITQNTDRPFFLYLAHNMPHVPLGVSEAFRGKSKRGLYGDVIEELDWSVGQVLGTLKELGIDEKTCVVFTSDNGPWVEEHLAGEGGIDAHYGSADPLRGWKMQTWEGGLRVPCIMRWPGKIPSGRVCREMITSMDLLPTFAKLAGAEMPQDRIVDGVDVFPVIAGEPGAKNPRETFLFYCYNHLQAVRHNRWKLVLPRSEKPPWCSWSARMVTPVNEVALYDLQADIGEEQDVAKDHPEVVAELMKLVEKAREDLGDYDQIGKGARFFDEGPRRPDAVRWQKPKPADGGGPYPRDFGYQAAIGPEKGVSRRDPSDVIQVEDQYYVWYSKVTEGPDVWGYPSGYSADVYYATSPDGTKWTEQGMAVGKGDASQWDGHGVFTPNILRADGKYYVFYTAVAEGHSEKTPTRIGVAVSQSPNGPWKKSEQNPVLVPGDDPEGSDSMRVDDASLVVREGKYWLYYKGRQLDHSPGETKMGVAIAERPEGPYRKHQAGPLHPGHEVLVWPHGTGVASMATAAGPKRIYFAADGIGFEQRNLVSRPPQAPGLFRNDHFQNGTVGDGIRWGISHARAGRDLYLLRFDCRFVPSPAASKGRPKPVPYDNVAPVGNLRFDFETGDLEGWQVVEGEFDLVVSDQPSLVGWPDVPFNKQGKHHLSTVERRDGRRGDDTMTGVIQSPRFVVRGKAMSFLVGGGNSPETYVALCSADGTELMRAGGTNSPVLQRVNWDVGQYSGQEVYLRIVDRKKRVWAHITFDDFSTEGELQ